MATTGLGALLDSAVFDRLNSGIGSVSATSSKLSLLTTMETCLVNKSSLMSRISASLGRVEVKVDAFPCSNPARDSGVSLMILIFMFNRSELLLGDR